KAFIYIRYIKTFPTRRSSDLALKEADCSIAMASGSEAAKNTANLVLLDSNFASMPHIVNEGRRVINNIRNAESMFLIKTMFSSIDRKSTHLNSSHVSISYAVF